MKLYAEYIKERAGIETIFDDRGFATYKFLEDGKTCYIVDIYVKPEYRKDKVASQYANKIAEKAKASGCALLLGSVDPSVPSAEVSRNVLKGYGMREWAKGNIPMEYFIKEID